MRSLQLSVNMRGLSVLLAASGCAADAATMDDMANTSLADVASASDPGIDEDVENADEPGAVEDAGTTRDPNAPVITHITALGTGCPQDSWMPAHDADGQPSSIDFGSWKFQLPETAHRASADCMITLSVRVPPGISFALSRYRAFGYSFLTEGAELALHARSYFTGTAAKLDRTTTSEWQGPYDDYFAQWELRDEHDLVWSQCGVARHLNLALSASVTSDRRAAPGDAIAEVRSVGRFEFVTKPCTPPSVAATPLAE